MSDAEIDQNLDVNDDVVSDHHSKLVETVKQLDKRRKEKAENIEPTIQVAENYLSRSGVTHKNVKKLKGSQKKDQSLNKKFRHKKRALPKALEKLAAQRTKRTVGYDNVKKDLNKWNAIVARNRTADRLFFPLKRTEEVKDVSKITPFLRGFKTKSDLMKKFEEVDPLLLYPPAEEEKKDNEYKMTMEEMTIRRMETAKFRAQQSYQEAKARRQRKIKSKKFHRIERKDKIKQQLKEFEKLQNTNPEEALEKLEQLDKTRAEERMSLRHKNTGQWAKNQQIRAKYNKETRQVLANQLAISRELTQKLKRIDSDDSEDEEKENENDVLLKSDKENDVKTENEIDDFIKEYRRYWDEKKKEDKKEKNIEISNEVTSEKKEVILCNNKVSHKTINEKKSNDILQENANDMEKKSANDKKRKNANDKERKNANDLESENLCNTVGATSEWQIEEYNTNETKNKLCNKKYKSQDISEIFDSMEEKLKHKVNLKLQKVKNKFKIKNNVEKQEEDEKEKENEDDLSNLEFKNSKQKPILDSPLEETTSRENVQTDKDLTSLKTTSVEQEPTNNSHEVEIDPKRYLNMKPRYLRTQIPDIVTGEEENGDKEEEMHKIMSEAFADDDVVEEFRKEQEEEMEKSQPKNIDLSLPGWGSWTGPNIKKSKIRRKKKRFILNIPKEAPRKPENQGKVIIFENDDKKLRKHLVNELPYPFTRVKDYEANIRAPISRTFVPMNAHLRITQPTVNTKIGQVIEPMDEDVLMKKPTLKKSLKRHIDKKTTVRNVKRHKPSKDTNQVKDTDQIKNTNHTQVKDTNQETAQ